MERGERLYEDGGCVYVLWWEIIVIVFSSLMQAVAS